MRKLRELVLVGLSLLPGCKRSAASWQHDGDELGTRVRNGEVPGVSHHHFHSNVLGADVGLVVAKPNGAAQRAVYFLPGIGGNEWAMFNELGLEHPLVQALWQDGKRAPLLVFVNPGDSGGYGAAERMLAEELTAYVEHTFHTRAEPAARALLGFSLGGATALSLVTRRGETFGRAVAMSSACYLIPTCKELRQDLRTAAKQKQPPVILAVGEKEQKENKEISEELAPLLKTRLIVLPRAAHNVTAQLAAPVDGVPFAARVVSFLIGD